VLLRLQAAAIAGLLLVGGVRVATYSESSPSGLTGRAVWEHLLSARSARVRMATDRSVAGRAPIRITVAGTIETAGQRTSLVVERDGRRQYDEVTVGLQVYVRPTTHWYSFIRAEDDAERPLAIVGLLADAGPLTLRSHEEVDGTATTRYATTARGLAMEIWLDRELLPRRISVYEGPNTRTVVFSDFLGGQPVAVPAGATSVHDLPEAIRKAAGK
jgi:hypothetical protein